MMALSDTEKTDLRIILEKVFGFQETSHWNMNEQVLEVVSKVAKEAQQCSNAMDYVPRPSYFVGKDFFKKQLRDIARRATSGESEFYDICAKSARYKWRFEIERASQGL